MLCNHADLLRLASSLSGAAKEFTTNVSVPLPRQIDLFNSFDLILGSHGSQWALSWFAEKPQAIVEFQGTLSSRDLAQSMTSKGQHFFVSVGHEYTHRFCSGLNQEMQDEAHRRCPLKNAETGLMELREPRSVTEGTAFCELIWKDEKSVPISSRYLNLNVNLTIARAHISLLLERFSVCAPGTTSPQSVE